MNSNNEQFSSSETEESSIDLRQLFDRYRHNWHWFAISLVTCVILAFLYSRYSAPMYRVYARVLVNDDKKGGGLIGGGDLLGDLGGLLGGKSTVDNEAEIIKTKDLIQKVVEDLDLNITYYRKGRIHKSEVYETPFVLLPINLRKTFDKVDLDVEFSGDKVNLSGPDLDISVDLNSQFTIPDVGSFRITRQRTKIPQSEDYKISIESVDSKIAHLSEDLDVKVANKLITIIDLTLKSPVPIKGVDVLNRLIYNYVEQNLKDKNEVADSTISFIQRRLMVIGSELGNAEGSIEAFKQKNNLADMSEQGKLLVASSEQYLVELAKVETQISIVNSLLDYLKDTEKNKRVLPSSLVSQDLVFGAAIEKYNSLVLERGRKLIGLSESNPVILNLDNEIANARLDIQSNLTSTLNSLNITRNKMSSQVNMAESQIKKVPATERNYLQLARQQQIKQELYLFLMQKSEETAISKTANISNSRTIDSPRAEIEPYAPKKAVIFLFATLLGLFIPVGLLYIKDVFNDKIESKADIEKFVFVPIVGEISHNSDYNNLVIANSSRSPIAEQFRALRTNLAFYLRSPQEKVILFTSSMSGEGKSFAAINLGNILALSGKRVCLMELDLRKPGLSSKLGIQHKVGFTNYVISDEITEADIIKQLDIHSELFIIPSGPLPPNPAETLLSDRTSVLLNKLKSQFDFIIIDAPPVGIVADAHLLAPFSDLCLYLVRQNFTRKDQLHIVRDLYKSGKMKKLGIVVNDINDSSGYGYGYGYGYGNGYGSYGE